MNKQRGRKPLGNRDGTHRIPVYLPDDLYQFVQDQTSSASAFIRKAVEREFRRRRVVERERKGAQ